MNVSGAKPYTRRALLSCDQTMANTPITTRWYPTYYKVAHHLLQGGTSCTYYKVVYHLLQGGAQSIIR